MALSIYFDHYEKGEFHECHDVMEEIWFETETDRKGFFQGLLQCAIARRHFENGNLRGAKVLARDGMKKLVPFLPRFLGVDVSGYLDDFRKSVPEGIWNREKGGAP